VGNAVVKDSACQGRGHGKPSPTPLASRASRLTPAEQGTTPWPGGELAGWWVPDLTLRALWATARDSRVEVRVRFV